MPTPMMPQVPTSMRFLGLYMSTMLRVKSRALAPSLTSIASGFALTMSRTTFSALWKFIGAGANIAHYGRVDAHVAVRLLRRDVDLDEFLPAPVLVALHAPGLALAVR